MQRMRSSRSSHVGAEVSVDSTVPLAAGWLCGAVTWRRGRERTQWLGRRPHPRACEEQGRHRLDLAPTVGRYLCIVGIDAGTCTSSDQRHFGLGLVDLDILLQAMNKVFLEIAGRYGGFGNFPQRYDRILVVVALKGDLRAG